MFAKHLCALLCKNKPGTGSFNKEFPSRHLPGTSTRSAKTCEHEGDQKDMATSLQVVKHLISLLRVMAKGLERTSDVHLRPPVCVTHATGRTASVQSEK